MDTTDPKPKHKPSEKHTLEEVLKSLQDLIHNEVLQGDAPKAPETPAAAAAGIAEPAPAPPGPMTTFEEVVESLEHLMETDLTIADPDSGASPVPSPAPTPAAAESVAPETAPAIGAGVETNDLPPPTVGAASAVPPAAPSALPGQQIFAFGEAPAQAAVPAAPTTVPDEETPAAIGTASIPSSPATTQATSAPAADATTETTGAPPDSFAVRAPSGDDAQHLDDIPVLQDVVAPPPYAAAAGSPISVQRARDVVLRVVARLNLELRRRGAAALDPAAVERLQLLLREELERLSTEDGSEIPPGNH